MDTLFFAAPFSLGPAVAFGVLGLLIGSFLNVVIHRLPQMMIRDDANYVAHQSGKDLPHTGTYNLVVPRSACPHCGHQITALENIPLVSWAVLGGKCSACKAPISVRYPIVEALTGLLSAYVIWTLGSGWAGMAGLGFLWAVIALCFIDADTQLLPDDIVFPLLWAGLLLNVNATFVPLRDAVIGAAVGYLSLWTVNLLYRSVRGQDGMGYGDFKLLAAIGAWLGWTLLPAVILMSSVVGAFVGLTMIVFFKHKREVPIPFGPYLAAAGLITLLFRPQLELLSRGFGL